MSVATGSRLGPYEIGGPLGSGGMGEVYRARDTKLNRDVAIKVLPDALADDGERLARFTREAQTLAALNHPNIAHIHGLEEVRSTASGQSGVRALVMELVEGEDLADRLARGAIPIGESIALARQIADGLEAAHEKGIVHRDLKPGNIKITPDGVVKILDFGLAKAMDQASGVGPQASGQGSGRTIADSPTITSPAHTRAGMILGTAAYMAPEQARGKTVDRRADIWAFGVVLFEMLSGHRVFAGETVSDVLAAVLTRQPDWQALPAETPASVRRLLARCLETDPRRRLRDIGDARWDLDATPDAPAPAAASSPRWRLRQALPWVIAALATLIAGGMAVLRPGPSATPGGAFHLDVMLPLGVEPASNLSLGQAISPDGRTAAIIGIRNGVRRVFLRRLDSTETTELPDIAGANGVVFSPDGTSLGVWFSSGVIERVTLADRQRKVVLPGGADSNGAFAWGASDVVFTRGAALWAVSADGGSPRPLTTLDAARGEVLHVDAVALPGGRTILFGSLTTEPGAERIEAVDIDNGRRSIVVERATSPVFSPTGHLLFARDGALLAAPFDPETATIRGTAVPVLRAGTVGTHVTGGLRLKLSAAGTLLYEPSASATNRVLSVGRDGAARALDLPPGDYDFPRVSADGTRLLVVTANSMLETFDLVRGTRARLTAAAMGTGFPAWTADSSRVVFRRFSFPTSMMADGSGEPTRVPSLVINDYPAGPGPDADSELVTRVQAETSADVYLVSISGAFEPKPLVVTRAYEGGAQLSPDGRWLLYQSNESGQMEVYVRPYPSLDRRWQISESGGIHGRWSRTGAEIFYRSNGQFMAVGLDTSSAVPVFAKPVALFADEFAFGLGLTVANYDVTPDGRFILLGFNSGGASLRAVIGWTQELKRTLAEGGVK